MTDEKTGQKYTDLGRSIDWGFDTILALDGITGLSSAIMANAQAMMNKTPLSMSQPVWGLAIQNQMNFMRRITSANRLHHVIVISHLKLIGPKTLAENENDVNKTIKQQMAELVPTRWYPTALGQEGAKTIAGEFPIVVNMSVENVKGKVGRRFNYSAREDMDLKFPSEVNVKDLSVENGLLEIFKALGAQPPKE